MKKLLVGLMLINISFAYYGNYMYNINNYNNIGNIGGIKTNIKIDQNLNSKNLNLPAENFNTNIIKYNNSNLKSLNDLIDSNNNHIKNNLNKIEQQQLFNIPSEVLYKLKKATLNK